MEKVYFCPSPPLLRMFSTVLQRNAHPPACFHPLGTWWTTVYHGSRLDRAVEVAPFVVSMKTAEEEEKKRETRLENAEGPYKLTPHFAAGSSLISPRFFFFLFSFFSPLPWSWCPTLDTPLNSALTHPHGPRGAWRRNRAQPPSLPPARVTVRSFLRLSYGD